MRNDNLDSARSLINSKASGILSTISLKLDGYPFGSVVPYCLDDEGMPVVLISTIAEHTKNISSDKRSSITIVMESDDVQANGRLCVIGDMERLSSDESDVKERYYRHFPNSRSYDEVHDFFFFRLRPVSIRYIGGFGRIHWFEPSDYLDGNPFRGDGEKKVVEHMNDDHSKELVRYCEYYNRMSVSPDDTVRMVGIDSLGFDVFVNDRKVRFMFKDPITNSQEAREALVEMSKEVK